MICGCDQAQEWLLPWWWSRYREHNEFPVTFFDFGMSKEALSWCKERGRVMGIEWDPSVIVSRSGVDPVLVREWEEIYGWTLWNCRLSWFKKPQALLHSPYSRGIWVDLDCEILGSLAPLFTACEEKEQIALVREYPSEHLPKLSKGVKYNGGVIAFHREAPILQKWAKASLALNGSFMGDDPLLAHLIYEEQLDVGELPEAYNWRLVRGLNLNAVILHWVGSGGKEYIRTHGGIKPALDAFYSGCRGGFLS